MVQENERLRSLLGMQKDLELSGVAANVVGYDPSGWVRSLVINQGASSGVSVGLPVVDSQGVVGQVIAAGRYSGRVLLITDHSSGVDALVQRTRARGVLEGSGESLCELSYVERNSDIISGDTIITSGMDGVYPKGLVLGTVSGVRKSSNGLFLSVEVEPQVRFAKLENVFVVTSKSVGADEQPTPRTWSEKTERR